MSERSFNFIRLIWPIFLFSFFIACGEKDTRLGKEALIRVEDRVVTVLDFNEAFEISKMAFDSSIGEQSEDLQKAQLRLLNEMIIEMILLEKAQEIEITVTDAELEAAVSDIKNDYPAGEFEETLLEFAVSYDTWKNRLKTRLIIDKVIEKELENRITITPEDITDYYQKNYQGKKGETGPNPASGDINEIIVKQLRRKKAEEGYQAWIEELKATYQIEINGEQWKKISGSPSIKDYDPPDSDSKNS